MEAVDAGCDGRQLRAERKLLQRHGEGEGSAQQRQGNLGSARRGLDRDSGDPAADLVLCQHDRDPVTRNQRDRQYDNQYQQCAHALTRSAIPPSCWGS
jgi:hypothetical protein